MCCPNSIPALQAERDRLWQELRVIEEEHSKIIAAARQQWVEAEDALAKAKQMEQWRQEFEGIREKTI